MNTPSESSSVPRKPNLVPLHNLIGNSPVVMMLGNGLIRFDLITENRGRVEATSSSGGMFFFPLDQKLDLVHVFTPTQATAQKLVEQWASRESALKQRSVYFAQEIYALSRCRRELQAAFGLDSEKPA